MKSNFEEQLPSGYKLAKRIDAKQNATMTIYLLLSFVPVAVTVGIALAIVFCVDGGFGELDPIPVLISLLVCVVIMIVYVILHELVHGAAYKARTGRKLTFGLTLTVAFCGVPDIYVYRKTALIAVLMPFLVFTPIFAALSVGMYFVSPIYFIEAMALLGIHVGGCVGDLHVTHILATTCKANSSLMRDFGPAQEFYVLDKTE